MVSRVPGTRQGQDDLSPRQADMLFLVVEEYIRRGEPVSSLYITDHFDTGVSSATIRSLFSDLDQKGFLFAPHRSAGRIPTEMGYRFYVERLPMMRSIADLDRSMIQQEYLKRDFRLQEILDVTSRILSLLTKCAGVVLSPEPETSVVKHIELIDMGEEEILVVIVTRSGSVYTKTLFLENRIPGDVLQQISRHLNDLFKGHDLRDIRESLKHNLENTPGEMLPYFSMVARTMAATFDYGRNDEELFTWGVDNLYAAFGADEERLREVGSLFASGEVLHGIFKKTISMDDVAVVIDGDRDERLAGLSIITGSYKMGEKNIGAVGIVAPNRIDYVRVMGIVEYIRRMISGMVTRISN